MKKRVQFKRVNDLVRGYVKEGITSYGSIVLPNGNPAVRMGISFKFIPSYITRILSITYYCSPTYIVSLFVKCSKTAFKFHFISIDPFIFFHK